MKDHSCKETIKRIAIIRLTTLLLQLIVVKVLVDANVIIIIVKCFVRPAMGKFHNVSLCNSPQGASLSIWLQLAGCYIGGDIRDIGLFANEC